VKMDRNLAQILFTPWWWRRDSWGVIVVRDWSHARNALVWRQETGERGREPWGGVNWKGKVDAALLMGIGVPKT